MMSRVGGDSPEGNGSTLVFPVVALVATSDNL